ncbi:hypothetical protein [Shinella granuli]|uniref:hypothetical protein n=1 Tax=Shinella granuli TaxID=323621 RepID=UPI0031EE6A4E
MQEQNGGAAILPRRHRAARGTNRGRKPGSKAAVFTPEDDAEIIRLYIDGAPYDVIAKEVGQPRTNVFNRCRLLGLPCVSAVGGRAVYDIFTGLTAEVNGIPQDGSLTSLLDLWRKN